ncbi:MAG: hypothetical protein AAB633_02355 [Patescibacteria group bacterium]
MTTVVKATSKGQITLPVMWRRKVTTDRFIVKEKGAMLEIRPLDLRKIEEVQRYTTIFDTVRDNTGKGIPAKDFLAMLRRINRSR